MIPRRFAAAGAAVLAMCAFAAVPSAHAQKKKAVAAEPAAEETEDPSKFFLFHLDGVSTEIARADLMYCIGQARPILSMRDRTGGGGGLLGALINGRMAEIDRTRMRNASMRKCMAAHGYARYQLPSTDWKLLVKEGDIVVANNGQTDPEVVDRMAAWASGPTPNSRRLEP
ncbi:hypothetical protein P1X14_03785 [Sphingomonas sp. AOB5]|uniref:hypothetical protein n=1 Tax=Sphingomonas sp. AOB5 TaxID=3034017 RepID=UPI0023F61B14|nr:hypothetical protein [Sphingomonas sp. AOB5]MDF7774356.1 hypothetical protein [Sphingomonas sp. AOB5]